MEQAGCLLRAQVPRPQIFLSFLPCSPKDPSDPRRAHNRPAKTISKLPDRCGRCALSGGDEEDVETFVLVQYDLRGAIVNDPQA